QVIQVIDVGAFAGAVSCYCLALWDALNKTGGVDGAGAIRVTALEPSPLRCAALQGDLREETLRRVPDLCRHQERSQGRLEAHCVAASSEDSEALMQCPNGMSFLAEDAPHAVQTVTVSDSKCEEATWVKTVKLDTLTKDLGIQQVHLLKVDAEGHDLEVLRGASRLFQARRIRFVIFEACGNECPQVKGQSQTERAMEFFHAAGYVCFIIAPEMLIPTSGEWLTKLYKSTWHVFNVLCAHRSEPLMKDIIQQYTRVPRAAQFALSALENSTSCGRSCLDPLLGDAVLLRRAAAAELVVQALHERMALEGWNLYTVDFARARSMQSAGQANAALVLYQKLQARCCREPATFEAQREYHKLKQGYIQSYLKTVAGLLEGRVPRNGTRRPGEATRGALHEIAWYHQRAGSGAPFEQVHKCQALKWLSPLAEAGDALACLEFGYLTHFGLCTGRMTRQSLAEASRWYRRAMDLDTQKRYGPGVFAVQVKSGI
ncbi:unnamed protein product, partial [Durusdinium trenchii]